MMYNKCDKTYILSEFLLYSVVFPQIIFVYDIFQNTVSQNYYKTHFLSETKVDFSYKFHFEILLFEIRYRY